MMLSSTNQMTYKTKMKIQMMRLMVITGLLVVAHIFLLISGHILFMNCTTHFFNIMICVFFVFEKKRNTTSTQN